MSRLDMVPDAVFLTKGVGVHPIKLNSFELALREAKIARFNLVYVSSIFPPYCRLIEPQEGLDKLKSGGIVHCVLARNQTNEPGRLICSAIGMARPDRDRGLNGQHGYISEVHEFGLTKERTEDLAEDSAAVMLASLINKSAPDWDQRKQIYKIKGNPIRTSSMVQTAKGKLGQNGESVWVTTVVAAVFVFD